ncbi:hypothetical protein, partial [Cohnella hongkongensis]
SSLIRWCGWQTGYHLIIKVKGFLLIAISFPEPPVELGVFLDKTEKPQVAAFPGRIRLLPVPVFRFVTLPLRRMLLRHHSAVLRQE